MATLKSSRRSVSPFGIKLEEGLPFAEVQVEFERVFGKPPSDQKPSLKIFSEVGHLPVFLRKLAAAAANDAPELGNFCQFLLTNKIDFEAKGLEELLYRSMEQLFEQKTEIFLLDHQNTVLFARERDLLVGRFFSPWTEKNPGLFSEFVNRWVQTDNLDRILHFLDFATGSKTPTLEHYLVFSHPALQRILSNKQELRILHKKTEPLLNKLTSPTWEPELREKLEI